MTETIRKNMLWNVIGSVGFIGAQWMMTILIVHLADYTQAGYLSLGLSLTNIFTNIAYFCIRNFQVSDVREKYSAAVYVTHRAVFSALAAVLYGIFVLANGYGGYVTAFLLLFMLYRLNEPIVDVFHGIDQKAWRLDVAGKSYLMRGGLTLAAFLIVEAWTKNLIAAALVMLAAAYGVILLWDIPQAGKCAAFCLRWDRERLWELTRECLPLFLYALCLNAVAPIPRYFLERIAGSETLGYYSSVAIPASVIQLLASYVFTTFTALFSEHLAKNEKREFKRLFWKLLAAILGLTGLAVLGSAVLGEWALTLLFTEKIRGYAYLLLPTVVCCGLIALIWYMGTILTILRDRKGLLAGAGAGTLAVMLISYPCIARQGVDGVNAALFVSSAITLLIFAGRFAKAMRKWK